MTKPRILVFKDDRRVKLGDHAVLLSPRAFELFTLFADANGRVLTAGYLADALRVNPNCAAEAVNELIRVTRREIAPLNLLIEFVHGEGWFMKSLGLAKPSEREDLEALLAACSTVWNAPVDRVFTPRPDPIDYRTRDAAIWYLFKHCNWEPERISEHFNHVTVGGVVRIVAAIAKKPPGYREILEAFAAAAERERRRINYQARRSA